jgi:hypothetical protein
MSPAPQSPLLLNRRQALLRIAVLMGGALAGADALLRGESLAATKSTPGFSAGDIAFFDEIAETIIPATRIPGAKAAKVGAFMAVYVNDCLREREHLVFQDGLAKVADLCDTEYSALFTAITPKQRTELISTIDIECRAYNRQREKYGPPHFFTLMKEVAVIGYFSSEIGATQAVRYVEVPGAYHGDVPYKKGDPAWYS